MDRKTAKFVQLALNDIGVRMRLVSMPCFDALERFLCNDDFEAALTVTGSPVRTPEILKKQWAVDPACGCSLLGCLENERIDRTIRRFLEEENGNARNELAAEIEKAFREVQPATFLFHKRSMDIMSRRIDFPDPFALDAEGINRLKYARFAKD